ncbi:MAG: hypothetical protein OQK12_00410 [Motiliproteus sp.]|nr:hypothetical protein [Motiliproteus sp.]MCW9053682.1 hypothetical protein [Motiliproteus sp.]
MKHYIENTLMALLLLSGSIALAPVQAEVIIEAGNKYQGHGYGHGHGGGVALVITSSDRFDPLVQKLMVERKLSAHPIIDEPKFLVVPHSGDAELTEMQIRYLEKLLDEAESEE